MSDIIQLLPDSVANQIAAGEVIQRPASVIKELVENAVDAGAHNININVIDAGRTLIQVIDDGRGMSDTDVRLAFERHATSKIRKADDLFSLHTMGFRGEALPSIAAVAQVDVSTRMADSELGSRLVISGSRVLTHEPCSCPVGCNFKVENLFFNVPARRKFLKSNATELNQILTSFERIALVYPEIHFTFHSNGSEIFNLREGNLKQRISDVFGRKSTQDLLPVEADTSMCRITGFVGKPESARKKGAQQYFFVNGRFMKHPYFAKAVQVAYERLIPTGEQTPYYIYMTVDPSEIDVNIHPTKTEIKFENEQSIWQILSAAVREAIGVFSGVPSIDFDTEGKPELFAPEYSSADTHKSEGVHHNSFNPFERKPVSMDWQSLYQPSTQIPAEKPVLQDYDLFSSSLTPQTDESTIKEKLSSEHYQYKGQYIVTSVPSGLMIVDQHRAHVRILFETYQKRQQEHKMASQRMLFPEAVQFGANDAAVLEAVLGEMTDLGFELTSLGGGNYAINAIPLGLEGINPSALVSDMIADVSEASTSVKENINSSLALTMARNAAIPAGQVLSNVEMNDLLVNLFSCSNINYTPDGKRIFTIIAHDDILKLF